MQGIAIAQVTPSPYKISGRLAKEFSDTVAKTPNLEVPPSYAMMEGYIAGKTIVEAARRMGPKASREAFVAALDTVETDMGGYRVGFKPGMRSGSRFVEAVDRDGRGQDPPVGGTAAPPVTGAAGRQRPRPTRPSCSKTP